MDTPTPLASSTGMTTQLAALSFLNDIGYLIHGKGGLDKIVPALDLIEKFAAIAAPLYPPAAAIAEAAQIAEDFIKS